jgi:type IV pilus assembly protein PilO
MQLVMEGTAKTFRYLDMEEVEAQRKAAAKKAEGK